MRILAGDSARLEPEFGILAGRWTQYSDIGDLPFGAMWCVTPPGGKSDPDQHSQRELVVIVSGSAEVQAGGSQQTAHTGNVVLLESEEQHVVVNRSGTDPLVTLNLYWEPSA
ncbi:MAG TPA: cupin domain-containing protein [Streptosporangiaceae bacterium]|nr:cupin domain-containing protein [Streptosporangiaceae bacterium]